MFVGVGTLEVFIPGSASLKEKRYVVRSLKDRINHKFNISVAEVGDLEKWQRATLGLAVVTNERRQVDRIFDKIRRLLDAQHEFEVIAFSVECY